MMARTTHDIHAPYGEPSSSLPSSSPPQPQPPPLQLPSPSPSSSSASSPSSAAPSSAAAFASATTLASPPRQRGGHHSTRVLYLLMVIFMAGAYVVFADLVNITVSDHSAVVEVRWNTATTTTSAAAAAAVEEEEEEPSRSTQDNNNDDNDDNNKKSNHEEESQSAAADTILDMGDLSEPDNLVDIPRQAPAKTDDDSTTTTTTTTILRSSNEDNNNDNDGNNVVLGGDSNSFTGNNKNNHSNNRFTARDYYPNHMPVPSWMESYIEFHRQQLEDPEFVSSSVEVRLKPGTRYIRYQCSYWCGGVGDRINGILSLFYVAMLTNRVLLIEHPTPFDLREVLIPNRIRWDAQVSSSSYPREIAVIDGQGADILFDPCATLLHWNDEGIVVRTNQWYGERWIWKTECFQHYFQQQSNATDYTAPHDHVHMQRWAFWTLFRFHDQVLARADVLKQNAGLVPSTDTPTTTTTSTNNDGSSSAGGDSISSPTDDSTALPPLPLSSVSFEPYIAIHIRGERHVGEENWRQFLVCAQQLQNAIQQRQMVRRLRLRRRWLRRNLNDDAASVPPPSPPLRLIFVADDSYHGTRQEIKTTMQAWDPEHVRVAPIEVYHVDHPRGVHDARQANIDTYAELVLLLDAECLVRSRSGYSELPHRITISNDETWERCGMQFDQCTDPAVHGAVQVLEWNRRGRRSHDPQQQSDAQEDETNAWYSWANDM